MALFDFLKKKELNEITELKKLLIKYQSIINLEAEEQRIQTEIAGRKEELSNLEKKYSKGLSIYKELKNEIDLFERKYDLFEVSIFEPSYELQSSEKYKDRIKELYELRKSFIANDKAIISSTNWTLNGSEKEGKKMTNNYKKLFLRAFNNECDILISKVKWNNVELYGNRILKLYETLNKLGVSFTVQITKEYLDLRLLELNSAYSHQLAIQKEKEDMQEARERMREEEKALRDYEKAQKQAEKEEKNFTKALDVAKKELALNIEENRDELLEKISSLEAELKSALEKKERAISMAQQTKRGYVYIISNIGSFGENVFKIGLTRRLEPMDRVRELGDASVPFHFDVHALIYSEDAPALERFLHKEFSNEKVNMLNNRKEFFYVSIEEIKNKLIELNIGIELIEKSEATDYRESLLIREQLNEVKQNTEIEDAFSENLF